MSDSLPIKENVLLADLTTIALGGPAQYFVTAESVNELREALRLAKQRNLAVHILGGGSNTIFSDAGFSGLVIKIGLSGVDFLSAGLVNVAAGEVWDDFVSSCIAQDLAGVETLSGIPGLVGATPIQNVGAYGQEVSQTIRRVRALDRQTLDEVYFTQRDCNFGYRSSAFKHKDAGRYIITAVEFQLAPHAAAFPIYPQLVAELNEHGDWLAAQNSRQKLQLIRQQVLGLRRRKSMLVDSRDRHSRSCGSFFINPVLADHELQELRQATGAASIPTFIDGSDGVMRVPAAWLIEQAGFRKGHRQGGVGISANHTLALVNYNGNTHELLDLALKIKETVRAKTGIELVYEPVLVE